MVRKRKLIESIDYLHDQLALAGDDIVELKAELAGMSELAWELAGRLAETRAVLRLVHDVCDDYDIDVELGVAERVRQLAG